VKLSKLRGGKQVEFFKKGERKMAEESPFNKLKTESVQKIYESNQQLIYVADRKVAALLLINAVLISFSATWNLREYSSSIKMIILIAVSLAVLSTILYLLAIILEFQTGTQKYLHYKDPGIFKENYVSKMTEMGEDDLMKDYLNTIYALSSIRGRKIYTCSGFRISNHIHFYWPSHSF
jgi:hypothetical protein